MCVLGNGGYPQALGFTRMKKAAAARPIATPALAKLYIPAHLYLNATKIAECIRKNV